MHYGPNDDNMHIGRPPAGYPAPAPRKRSSNLTAVAVAAPIVTLVIGAVLGSAMSRGGVAAAAPAATVTVTETATAFANSAPTEPAAAAPSGVISEGTYRVPQEVKPGTYHTSGGSGCYWARLSSLDGGGILANNLGDGPMTVTIRRTDKGFETSRCADWKKV